jgi:hypothetical protein
VIKYQSDRNRVIPCQRNFDELLTIERTFSGDIFLVKSASVKNIFCIFALDNRYWKCHKGVGCINLLIPFLKDNLTGR